MKQKICKVFSTLWHSWIVWILVGVFAILQWYYWPRSLTRELGKISPGLVPQYEKQLDEASQTDLFIYYGYMTPDVTLRLDNTPISIERFWEEVKETTVWRRSREDFFFARCDCYANSITILFTDSYRRKL